MAHPVAIEPPATPTARPTGVTVLAVLAAIAAVFAFFGGLAAMALGAMAGAMVDGFLGALGAIAGILMLAYSAFAAATAWGLWTRKTWAWMASVILAGLQILTGLASLAGMDVMGALFGLAVGGLVVWYLFSPPVQAWFGTSYKVPWTYK